jgi:hypothetical protein
MQIPVLVERLKRDGYRARGGEPFALTARGSSREEALAKLRSKIQNRMKNGLELVQLEIGSASSAVDGAGIFSPNDPLIQEWIAIMADNRKKIDEDPEVL